MSQENVDIVRRMLACFHQGDAAGALACFSRDVVVDASRRPDGRTGVGRSDLAAIIGQWLGAFEAWSEEIHQIHDLDDRVIVVATQRGRGKRSGVEVATEYATIYRVRGGEIAALTLYPDPAEGLRAAGL